MCERRSVDGSRQRNRRRQTARSEPAVERRRNCPEVSSGKPIERERLETQCDRPRSRFRDDSARFSDVGDSLAAASRSARRCSYRSITVCRRRSLVSSARSSAATCSRNCVRSIRAWRGGSAGVVRSVRLTLEERVDAESAVRSGCDRPRVATSSSAGDVPAGGRCSTDMDRASYAVRKKFSQSTVRRV